MKMITRMEEMILLSVLNLEEDAYLVSIQKYLSELLERKISLTSIHLPLNRLEKYNYLAANLQGATAVRGGRRKKIYHVTETGLEALNEYRIISDKLWNDHLGMGTS